MSDASERAEVILIVIKRLFKWLALGVLGIVVLVGLGIGGISLYDGQKREMRKQEALAQTKERRERIERARSNATSDDKKWGVVFRIDPASGEKIIRMAAVRSNDGLCRLQVEKRLNGTELTGFYCKEFTISPYNALEAKFDFMDKSESLPLKKFSDGNDVYIPSSDYSLPKDGYKKFLQNLSKGKMVAFRATEFEGYWVSFTLRGAAEAISGLGKPDKEIKGSKHP